ncbi:[protein release factor]-glutamine N5-methyltransferase [Tamilnaduibacter salinus]|uniref:Release factor glutamine methyltransferase n=1 Tax=Tamilnaduibacter salinus TaxID=1484056 RepID=A0A2A2I7G5_9GAMM|nr:peptide chain release factor N(5)-glutamine methyltransferase [Tamilnaduibacter salinus]PAV27234.1 protein-(glutamine-N5) methyltransferase, release factor-specific [Tamilnaduibacter salinus]PVY78926.1 [protein release factor]-glutamine N5-methyltransferase [Tamilnaduibacter salinus]
MSNRPRTIELALSQAVACIASESPRVDAERLLEHVIDRGPTWFRTWPDKVLTDDEDTRFQSLVERRAAGEPVAHLTGSQGFWSLDLAVSTDTLIPRPDTETLIEVALTLPLPANAQVLDLGTGTGAIALALASERGDWQVTACDSHRGAVDLAQRNAQACGLGVSVQFSDWFHHLPVQPFDLIVSNPPYIRSGDPHLAQGDVRWEPVSALVSGEDGLDAIRHILREAPDWLGPSGWLALEHGYDQGQAVRALFRERGFADVATHRDYGDQERVTRGCWRVMESGYAE